MKAATTTSTKEQIQQVIEALDPEPKSYVWKNGSTYYIHSPLMILRGIEHIGAEPINQAYREKKIVSDDLLADVRFDPGAYLAFIEKPYRLDGFIEIQSRLTDCQYWRQLQYIWILSEYLHIRFADWLRLFRSNRRYRMLLMNRDDRKAFEALPNSLTIYRGYQHGAHKHKMGLSWTLSQEKAVWFAHRRPENGKAMIVTATCAKSNVFCYTNERNEEEIIVDPSIVIGARAAANIGPSPFKSH